MNRKTITLIVLGLILFATLLVCGYFGVKAVRRTRLRRAAMTAYEKKEYVLAERLLLQYVSRDPNAEAEFVALANIYHEFGNAGMEAQMWQTASSLNPLKPEYRDNMLTSAAHAASYTLLHGILGPKVRGSENCTDRELSLYVISSYRSGYQTDGDAAYRKAVKADPEAFHKSELGRMAEFIAGYADLSEGERDAFLDKAMKSEDPVIRFEVLYSSIGRILQRGEEADGERIESRLKQAVEVNYYAGTPLLADYYFSKYRFGDALDVLEPYLKTIDNLNLYLLYAECCVFEEKLDELKELKKKLSRKPGVLQIMADYCEILIAYLENDEEKLAAAVRQSGKLVTSPLSRFIRLRVALANESFNEIRTVAQEIFSSEPFHNLHTRALVACMDYISVEMMKTENRNDPSRMAELAKILSGYLRGNRMLTEIILVDQYKRGLAKEEELTAALEEFPDDRLLLQITAEYLVLNGKPEQALDIIKPVLSAAEGEEQPPAPKYLILQVLALDQLGQRDEASAIFQKMLEQSEFDLEILPLYFQYCERGGRTEDLASMADKLDTVKDGKLGYYGKFFRAAALLATEDEAKKKEALDLLASAPNDDPEFTLYAANSLSDNGRLDEAEAKYKAILKTYHTPPLVLVNLSELYHEKGDEQKALETAKEAFDMDKSSMLPAFIYAKRLSEANRFEEAVGVLNFPHHAVNYREDVVELWSDCMRHAIEKSMAAERFSQAEEQCKHLLVIAPNDEFGKETMEKIREILKAKKDRVPQNADAEAAPAV